jgi:hypothetical protein
MTLTFKGRTLIYDLDPLDDLGLHSHIGKIKNFFLQISNLPFHHFSHVLASLTMIKLLQVQISVICII